jgi:hypothetical protein
MGEDSSRGRERQCDKSICKGCEEKQRNYKKFRMGEARMRPEGRGVCVCVCVCVFLSLLRHLKALSLFSP